MDSVKPVNKRIEQMDIIRGFALFGVLLVNLTMIDETLFSHQSSPFVYSNLFERMFSLLLHIFATGKFYTLFAILFGMGTIIFINRFESDLVGAKCYKRRLLVLLVLGLFHLVFVWYGDILHVYAIAGFLMLSKRNLSAGQLLRWSMVAFAFSTLMFSLLSGTENTTPEMLKIIEQSIQAYIQNDYLSMVKYRVTWELPMILINLVIVLPKILSLFFLGAGLAKLDVFDQSSTTRHQIDQVFKGALIASIIFACGYMIISSGIIGTYHYAFTMVFEELLTISGALFYSTALIVVMRRPNGLKKLKFLSAVGRMSLTNYLMQTLFFTTLLYGYGGGLFHKLPYWSYLPISAAFFLIQVLLSSWWLRRFKTGPVEYVTRKLTYPRTR